VKRRLDMFDCHLMLLPVPNPVESAEPEAPSAVEPEAGREESLERSSLVWGVPGLLERGPVKVPAT
jgi:hypothetical protein